MQGPLNIAHFKRPFDQIYTFHFDPVILKKLVIVLCTNSAIAHNIYTIHVRAVGPSYCRANGKLTTVCKDTGNVKSGAALESSPDPGVMRECWSRTHKHTSSVAFLKIRINPSSSSTSRSSFVGPEKTIGWSSFCRERLVTP